MFELLIHALKRIPRPLVPLVPIVVMLLGPALLLLLIVHLVPEPPGDEVGWTRAARNNRSVERSVDWGSRSQATVLDQTQPAVISRTSSQEAK